MKKGISFFFGVDYDPKQRAKDIKNAGLDCVMTSADPRHSRENGKISRQVRCLKKAGLEKSSLHMQYQAADLPHFFMDNKIGAKLEKTMKKDLKIAKKYGFSCVVVHLSGEISDFGVERFKRVLALSEKVKIPLALENLDKNYDILKFFFENFKSDCVKFCYDSGHHHCFMPEKDLIGDFGDRLACVHLHDNMGTDDDHTLNRYGDSNWKKIAKDLARCPEVSLDYELLFHKKCELTNYEILRECHDQACELEKLIEKEKQKLAKSAKK